MKNAKLAWEIVDHITQNPLNWDQGIYINTGTECGTKACIAGWASLLSGDEPKPHFSFTNSVATAVWVNGTNEIKSVRERAEELLGIHWSDSDRLFNSTNTMSTIIEMVTEIFGPRPEEQ